MEFDLKLLLLFTVINATNELTRKVPPKHIKAPIKAEYFCKKKNINFHFFQN